MSQAPAPEAVEIRIKSAADLHQALASPDLGVRLEVLKAVGDNPTAALHYGQHQGRDVIDLLIDQVNTLENSSLRQMVLTVLSLLPGRRVKEALVKELHLGSEPAVVEIASRRLAAEEPAERLRIFVPFLMQADSPFKAREAAKALVGLEGLSPEQRLRMALVGTEPDCAPRLDAETWRPWLAELNGPHADYARDLLERQGAAAFKELKAHWAELDLVTRAWLLEWGTRDFALETVELLAQSLAEGPAELALRALECVPRYGESIEIFAQAAAAWAGHQDPRLRLAAIVAGATGVDLAAMARDGSQDEGLRLAAIGRLGREGDPAAAGLLAGLLADPSWRVRAAAARALGGLGEEGARAAREAIDTGSERARAAAAQVLLALGQDEWLAGHIER